MSLLVWIKLTLVSPVLLQARGCLSADQEEKLCLVTRSHLNLKKRNRAAYAMVKLVVTRGPRGLDQTSGTRLLAPVVRTLLVSMLGSCNTVGSIEERAETVNRTSADVVQNAILLNILRAREYEPLNFVSLTGVTGHNTATLGLGLPSFFTGPNRYGFGAEAGRTAQYGLLGFNNSTLGGSLSASNDFQVSVLDDPASNKALTKPVTPATIAFLKNQGYRTDDLFFIFVGKIMIRENLEWKKYPNEPFDYQNSSTPLYKDYYHDFYAKITHFLDRGLTATTDQSDIPGEGVDSGRLCFDVNEARPELRSFRNRYSPCMFDPQAPKPEDKEVTMSLGTIRITLQPDKSGQSRKQTDPEGAWRFRTETGQPVLLYTRSLYGAYEYLGQYLRLRERERILECSSKAVEERDKDGRIHAVQCMQFFGEDKVTNPLYLTHDSSNCFARTTYHGKTWCVPQDATVTKWTFSLLHQLFQLYAAPSNQPVTPTVRTVQ